MKTLIFVDANTKANANANSTIALRKHCSGKLKMKESEETEEIETFPLYPYLLQGQQALPNCSQYQLDAPVTQDTWCHCLTQPPSVKH